MFASQATQLFVGSTWKGALMDIVMIPRGYHTAAHPLNVVMLAIRVLQLNNF